MTHVKALQAGQSSQGTSEPITGSTDGRQQLCFPGPGRSTPSSSPIELPSQDKLHSLSGTGNGDIAFRIISGYISYCG